MERQIIHTVFLPHPPETVWEFLTDSSHLSEWLMENNFRPIEGCEFQFKAKARVNIGFDGNIYCQVTQVVPYKRLSYSWKGGPRKGKITLESIVIWTLNARDNGTELVLEHKGFQGFRNLLTYMIMNKGWAVILRKRLSQKLSLVEK